VLSERSSTAKNSFTPLCALGCTLTPTIDRLRWAACPLSCMRLVEMWEVVKAFMRFSLIMAD